MKTSKFTKESKAYTKKSVVVLNVMGTEDLKPKRVVAKRASDGMLTHLIYVILVFRHLRNQMLVWKITIIAETQAGIQSKLVDADSQMVHFSKPGILSVRAEKMATRTHTVLPYGH